MKKRGRIIVLVVILFFAIEVVSASRLPLVGGDNETWGDLLNDFLLRIGGANATELNLTMVSGGNIYSSAINTTHLLDGTITAEDLGNDSVSDEEIDYTSVTLVDFSNDANYLDKDEGGTIEGSVVINGNLTLIGSYINATITNESYNGTFLPKVTDLFDIGSALFKWSNLFVSNVYTTSIFADDWSNVTITKSQVSDADWWNNDANLSNDEISESKINFSTSCGAGNHLYVDGKDLACEVEAGNSSFNQSLTDILYVPNTTAGVQALLSGQNLTLGQKITFSFEEMIDNIVDGWVRITGGLNVTGNVSASNLLGYINWSYIQNAPSTLTNFFSQGTVGNTKGGIINNVDNHTQNSNNIIFAVVGNGTSGVTMPHFWIQNGGPGQASGISRSFMIVNENPTQQNTTNITSCTEYAAYAGKSLYIDCNTTTTGADLLVGDDMQVMGDTFTENTNVTGLLTTESITVHGNVSIKRPYGMFSSTETQVMTVADTAYPVTFNWTENAFQIVKASGNSNFSVQQTGNYLIEISAITDTDTVNKHIDIWVQKNGANLPRSNTKVQLPSANTKTLITVPFIVELNTTDSFRLMMGSDDGGSQLLYVAASGSGANAVPETPSIIMTITKLSELTS